MPAWLNGAAVAVTALYRRALVALRPVDLRKLHRPCGVTAGAARRLPRLRRPACQGERARESELIEWINRESEYRISLKPSRPRERQ